MKISRLNHLGQGRVFAVSELYGHFPALNLWLDKVRFQPSTDRVVLLGNFLGFAPSSRQATFYLTKPWISAVLGRNEADVLARLEGRKAVHQTLIGQWLSMMDEVAVAHLHSALKAIPVAIEWESLGGTVVFSQAPLPADQDWSCLKSELENTECPISGVNAFMSRIDILGCLGRLGKGPDRHALGVSWSISGYSVERIERPFFMHKNRIIVPSSTKIAQDSCYDTRCVIGSLDVTAFTNKNEIDTCHIDILPELYPTKTFSTKQH